MTTYLYADGESHYIMADKCMKRIHGEEATLAAVVRNPALASSNQRFWHNCDSKFFWDSHLTTEAAGITSRIGRAVYFTAFTGRPEDLQKARVSIREAGLEPQVSLELKDLAKQRENKLVSDAVVIKPKGVDIDLSVRMLEDAYYGNYQDCLLFTSDIDYLPAIRAVRRMGKTVIVCGFSEAIAGDSPFLYVPERFVDLGPYMQEYYSIDRE